MSGLYQTIFENIENYISEYAKLISQKYNLDHSEVFSLWSQQVDKKSLPLQETKAKRSPKVASPKKSSEEHFDMSPTALVKYTRDELAAVCKKLGLKVSGKKQELLDRILEKQGVSGENKEKSESPKAKESKVVEKKEAKKRSPAKKKEDSEVVKKITSYIPQINLKRNKWGNYEHLETKLVFDPETQQVIGKQEENGDVVEIDEQDIENCNKFKFSYKMPENLNKGKKDMDNVKIDELEEEEDEQVEEEPEIEDDADN
jgi:hypothetical protein